MEGPKQNPNFYTKEHLRGVSKVVLKAFLSGEMGQNFS